MFYKNYGSAIACTRWSLKSLYRNDFFVATVTNTSAGEPSTSTRDCISTKRLGSGQILKLVLLAPLPVLIKVLILQERGIMKILLLNLIAWSIPPNVSMQVRFFIQCGCD